MGLGSVLRKVLFSSSPAARPRPQNQSSNHPNGSANPRRSRKRPSHSFGRKKQSSPGLGPRTDDRVSRRRKSRSPPISQQEAQERAVITLYGDQLAQLATRISQGWARFDAEPDEYYVTLDIRDLRVSLQKALESYYAARGSRANHGIESIIQIMEDTDIRLARLDHEVLAEVERFEQAAMDIALRFSHAQVAEEKLNVCADADDALIELELYREGWVHIMDPEVHSRLVHTNSVLREVATTCVPIAHHASASKAPYPSIPNGDIHKYSYPETSQARDISPLPQTGGLPFVGTHFDSYAEVRRHQEEQEKHKGQSGESAIYNPFRGAASSHPVANGYHDAPKPMSSSANGGLGSRSDGRRDTQSSESGDEGAMKMVMSRTRTLRDMAASAMNQRDDFPGSTLTSPAGASRDGFSSGNAGPAFSRGFSSQGSYRNSLGLSPTASRSRDIEQPSMEQTHHLSFASALYFTRNERVDAISDAGLYLERSNVRGDGRCLFRALVRCRAVARGKPIPGERLEREGADHLRARAVAELIKYRELLARFFVIEGNFPQYTKKMSQPRTYGGEPELLMLAKILHVPIAVYISKVGIYRQIQVYGKQYRGEPLRILYSDGIHYDALLAYT